VQRDGEVWLAGERITDLPTYQLACLGLRRTFQQNAFFGELTLLENAMAASCASIRRRCRVRSRCRGRRWRRAAVRAAAAAELLSSFGIAREDHGKRPGDIA
jgi:branched-chain amino acid transport system ATP-binding protein